MATTRREYVFATFLSSCAALVLLIVACATNAWISSDLQATSLPAITGSTANYGLFSGTFTKRIALTNTYVFNLKIVCDFGENICAWSCMDDSSGRQDELSTLFNEAQRSSTCPYNTIVGSYIGIVESSSSSSKNASTASRVSMPKEVFLNAGLWLSTLLMLLLALLATAAAALLAVINTAANPKSSWMAVPGLYCCNGVAAVLDLLCLILWGSHFAVRLKNSIGLNEVISADYTSSGLAQIGWSYWLVLVALVISAANICVLFWRSHLIWREPPPPTYNPEKEVADGTLFLY